MKEFAHLHTHTEYSLLDGANQVGPLAKAANADQQRALAITDHGNMYGALNFYNACVSNNVKPIIGCEFYVAQVSRTQKHTKRNPYNHLTLLARNEEGYKNLLYLTSLSFVEGLSSKPRIDQQILSRHAEGIVCLSGCLSGKINEYLRQDMEATALDLAASYMDLFGKNNFYMELQRNGLKIQDKCNEGLIRISKKLNVPLVGTNDIHYLRHEDCDFQDTMLCIAIGERKSTEERFRFDTDDVYFKTAQEMASVFRDVPEAIRSTLDIAAGVDVVIPQGTPIFPKYDTDDPAVELEGLVRIGLKSRYGDRAESPEIQERAREELDVINRMGYPAYFLVVKDFVNAARNLDIPVGPGRGSAAGSIVAYSLWITNVDPLSYNLIFERFLNESRIGLPDIDIDFCKEGREKVLEYLRQKHGEDRVANIITFGRFQARAAFRNAAKVLELPLPESDFLAKKIPEGGTLAEAKKLAPEIKKAADGKHESLFTKGEVRQVPEKAKQTYDVACQLEGFVSHAGVHASGVVIGDRPLYELVPMARNKHGVIITQWDGDACEKLGLVKFDFLGLQTLTAIRACTDIIESRGKVVDIDKLTFDDPDVFEIFKNGDTEGIFQCYSDGMKRLLGEMQPDCFDDVIAALALFRPGPLESGIAKSFINRKSGKEEISYVHPDVEPYLGSTYGTMVYQEQVMQLAQVLAGFTMKQADELRYAIGKKKQDALEALNKLWLNGCKIEKKIVGDEAKRVWEEILKFGRYGFNKCLTRDTEILTEYGPVCIEDISVGTKVFTIDENQKIVESSVVRLYNNDIKPIYEYTFDDGSVVRCTQDHKFLTNYGQKSINEIQTNNMYMWGVSKKCASAYASQERLPRTQKRIKRDKKADCLKESEKSSEAAKRAQRRRLQEVACSERVCLQTGSPLKESEESSLCEYDYLEQISKRSGSCVKDSQNNLTERRYNKAKVSTTSEMEVGESRQICCNTSIGTKISKKAEQIRSLFSWNTIKPRVSSQCEQKVFSYSKKASRFYSLREEANSRGRWTPSLLSNSWRRNLNKKPNKRLIVRRSSLPARLDTFKNLFRYVQQSTSTEFQHTGDSQGIGYLQKGGLAPRRVVSATYIGECQTFDIEVDHPSHNFLLANGACTSNSHSVAYAMLSYQTAYLKKYHPVEFFAANLSVEANAGEADKVVAFIHDARNHGINVLPPSLRDCSWNFKVQDRFNIRIGLGGLKGIGQDVAEKLSELEFGDETNLLMIFKDTTSKCMRKNTFEPLARAGCLDFTGIARGSLVGGAEGFIKKLGGLRRRKTPLKEGEEPEYDWPEVIWEKGDLLAAEKEVYGFYLSGHPMEDHLLAPVLAGCKSIAQVLRDPKGKADTKIVGVISSKEVKTIKGGKNKGKKYVRLIVEDSKSRITCTVFSHLYQKLISAIDAANEAAIPMIITGRTDTTGEEPQVAVSSIRTFDADRCDQKEVYIPLDDGNIQYLTELKEALEDSPGETRILFSVTDNKGVSTVVRTEQLIKINDTIKEKLKLMIK